MTKILDAGPDIAAPAAKPSMGRPAPRWLWVATIAVVVAFTVLRLALASVIELRTDEAYYWTWSKEAVLSYLDQPPMVAWFVRGGTALLGDTPLGARLAFILALPLIELILADVARRRSGGMTAALLVVLGLEATISFGGIGGLVEAGIPLLLFVSALFWCLNRLEKTGDARWWLAIGVCGGLALLSKYLLVYFALALFVWVLATPANRRWLRQPLFWVGIAVALALFVPVLVWNAQHGWASFRFQFVRAEAEGAADVTRTLDFLGMGIGFGGLLLMPAVVVGSVLALIDGWRRRDALLLALAVAFLAPFLYLCERALHLDIYPTWTTVLWPFGIAATAIVAGRALPARRNLYRCMLLGIATGLPVTAALLLHGLVPGVWFGGHDPIGAEAGFGDLAKQVLALARQNGAGWIATSDYRTYAELRWQLRNDMPVVEVLERSRFIGFAPPALPQETAGPGLYVFGGTAGDPLVEATIKETAKPLGSLTREWRGAAMGSYGAELFTGWPAPLDAPPGSPFYAWVPLA